MSGVRFESGQANDLWTTHLHELLTPSKDVPVAPGDGPFRVRGAFYVQVLENARKLPGGMETLLAQLTDERVREFASTHFKWMAWYDAFPGLPLQVALGELSGRDFETAAIDRARESARSMAPRLFRSVISFGRPSIAFQLLPSLVSTYFDFVKFRVEHSGASDVSLAAARVPRFLAPMVVCTITGLIEGGYDLIKVSDRTVGCEDVKFDTPVNGYETLAFRLTSTWRMR